MTERQLGLAWLLVTVAILAAAFVVLRWYVRRTAPAPYKVPLDSKAALVVFADGTELRGHVPCFRSALARKQGRAVAPRLVAAPFRDSTRICEIDARTTVRHHLVYREVSDLAPFHILGAL